MTTLTPLQALIIVCMVTIGTMITRFLPFVLFTRAGSGNSYIGYLGKAVPPAAIGMLVVYCLKDVSMASPPRGIPEAIAIGCMAALHWWKGNELLSIGAGTIVYMLLVQGPFA